MATINGLTPFKLLTSIHQMKKIVHNLCSKFYKADASLGFVTFTKEPRVIKKKKKKKKKKKVIHCANNLTQ